VVDVGQVASAWPTTACGCRTGSGSLEDCEENLALKLGIIRLKRGLYVGRQTLTTPIPISMAVQIWAGMSFPVAVMRTAGILI